MGQRSGVGVSDTDPDLGPAVDTVISAGIPPGGNGADHGLVGPGGQVPEPIEQGLDLGAVQLPSRAWQIPRSSVVAILGSDPRTGGPAGTDGSGR